MTWWLMADAAFSQDRNAQWLFGASWIDFASGTPAVVGSTPQGSSPSACISDTNGVLQLYYTLEAVYNGSLQLIADANDIQIQHPSLSQASLILPIPDMPEQYLVMHNEDAYHRGCGYFRVDMTLNFGQGGLLDSDVVWLEDSASSRLTSVPHANGQDYWVLLHKWASDQFAAFLLSSSGLDTVPIISHAGVAHTGATPAEMMRYHRGSMVSSYDGDLLALHAGGGSWTGVDSIAIVEVFEFDDGAGTVQHLCSIKGRTGPTGIEISPDGSKLYIMDLAVSPSGLGFGMYLWQYDLSSRDSTMIIGSEELLFTITPPATIVGGTHGMVLGPDGKIYVRHEGGANTWLGVIQDPNEPGAAANYTHMGFDMTIGSPFSLPNMAKRYHDSGIATSTGEVVKSVPRLRAWPNPTSDYVRLELPRNISTAQVRIVNAQGQVVVVHSMDGPAGVLDVSDLPTAVYNVMVRNEQELVGTVRLAVQ